MAFQPTSNLILTNTPCTDYKNVILFSNATDQSNYFKSRRIKEELTDFSYIRKENSISVPFHIDELWNCNYIMYQNENYSNKWFYAFVTKHEYINNNVTKLYFETDVFQTWFLSCTLNQSFVVREHVADDTIGLHTVDENLNIGEVICEQTTEDLSLSEYFYVGVMSSWNPEGNGEQFSGITVYNKQIFGKQLYLFPMDSNNITTDILNLFGFIFKSNSDSHVADIENMFIIPSALIKESYLTEHSCTVPLSGDRTLTATYYTLAYTLEPETFSQNITKLHNFSGITVKNGKCFVYPYNYILISNNAGNQNIYKYEDFSNTNNATFEVQLALQIGISGRIVPKYYKGMENCDDEALPLAKYPTCSWSSDSYINWLTQQSVNLSIKGSQLIRNTLGSFGTNFDEMFNNASDIAGFIGEFYSASLMPNVESGQNTGDINFANNRITFSIRQMRAKNEYLKIIDDYFTQFGYKINEIKIPNIHSRRYWNYVETKNCNITGNIPTTDLNDIKKIFNDGVTIWHDTNNLYNYSLNNTII